jgi:hypothetical protein
VSFRDRQNRVRAVEALERAVKGFKTRKDVWPLYVPREPPSLDDLLRKALDGVHYDPLNLRSRTLLWLAWADGATWELWVITLPSGLKVYCDSDGTETRLLASGRRDSEIETDRLFLELLAESAGQKFGIEMAGGPPARVRSSIGDRELLVDFFVTLFEVEGLEEDVRDQVGRSDDFSTDVSRWLSAALGGHRMTP